MTIHTEQREDGEYGRALTLRLIDAEINSLLMRLGEMGYTKDDIVERFRKLYDNPTVAT